MIAVGASTSNVRLPSAYLAGEKPELIQSYRGILSANPPERPVTAPLVDVGEGTPRTGSGSVTYAERSYGPGCSSPRTPST